jgi:hypothetical protein
MSDSNRIPSFADFDARANDQDILKVAFMGGSLTWGANTTDPQLYSYRALIGDHLRTRYPHTPLRFLDASLGGQGSQLAVFRLNRDVIAHHPDLLFLEYSVNDDSSASDEERLASFESLVRRVIMEAKCPVFISILAIRDDVIENPPSRPRNEAHQRIAEAYGCGLAMVAPWIRQQIAGGKVRIEEIWGNPLWPGPSDHVHPGNIGQALYAEVIWRSFLDAIDRRITCRMPEKMLHAPTYMDQQRFRLSDVFPLPTGWELKAPNRVAGAYDFLMCRWLDDVLVASGDAQAGSPKALTLKMKGEAAFLFGEATKISGKYRVTIDGSPATGPQIDSSGFFNAATIIEGNMPHFTTLAVGLKADHIYSISIEPILSPGQELRFESLCVAGNHAWVGVS